MSERKKMQITIAGEGVTPETTDISDLAELLGNYKKAVLEIAKSQDVEFHEDAIISLVDVGEGSNKLTIAFSSVLIPCVAFTSQCISKKEFNRLPTAAHKILHDISSQSARRNWSIQISEIEKTDTISATISAEYPVPAPDVSEIQGTTTLYGRCIRVGGIEPKAQIRLESGELLSINISESLARQLAQRLYDVIGIEGTATWDTENWKFSAFKAEQIISYYETDPVLAFEELSKASMGKYDGVDVEEYLRELRS